MGYKFEIAIAVSIHKEDVWIFEVSMTRTEEVMELNRMRKFEKIPGMRVRYIAICIFRTDGDFIHAWGNVIYECNYHIDIEVWKLEKRIIKNKGIPIKRMNIK